MTNHHRADHSDCTGPTFSSPGQYNRDEINRARQAAEALFAPRIIEPSAPTAAPSPDQTAREPRILSAVDVQPTRVEPTEVPIVSVRPKPARKVPASHSGRIRTWMKFGMTKTQVAQVYGVTVGDIEHMLQKT
jgi:hypothetical protein